MDGTSGAICDREVIWVGPPSGAMPTILCPRSAAVFAKPVATRCSSSATRILAGPKLVGKASAFAVPLWL